jgi:hypothetical protein
MIVYITRQSITITAAMHSASWSEWPRAMNRTVRDFHRLAGIVISLAKKQFEDIY